MMIEIFGVMVKNHIFTKDSLTKYFRYVVYLKLFFIMGVLWISEVFSWKFGPKELWLVTDILNTLQGLSVHHGCLNGGHYYAVCKNQIDKLWHKYNDTKTQIIQIEQVKW